MFGPFRNSKGVVNKDVSSSKSHGRKSFESQWLPDEWAPEVQPQNGDLDREGAPVLAGPSGQADDPSHDTTEQIRLPALNGDVNGSDPAIKPSSDPASILHSDHSVDERTTCEDSGTPSPLVARSNKRMIFVRWNVINIEDIDMKKGEWVRGMQGDDTQSSRTNNHVR